MKYQHNAIRKYKNHLRAGLLGLPVAAALVVGFMPSASARGPAPTVRVGTVFSCTATQISVSVDTTVNDRVNMYLLQDDFSNVLVQSVPRRGVVTLTATGNVQNQWDGWRQERDGWKHDFAVKVDPATGTCLL